MSKASEKAYRIIRSLILSGEFRPGKHLKEEALTKTCGVSRTPVREALLNLSSDYYVEIIPNRGTFVTNWANENVEDIFNMRMLLEGYAVQLVAQKATVDQIREFSVHCDNIDQLLSRKGAIDVDIFLSENRLFHAKLWAASGSDRLSNILMHLVAQSVVARTAVAYTHDDIKRSNDHHKEIVDAIKTKDGTWARSVMYSHLSAALQVYMNNFSTGHS